MPNTITTLQTQKRDKERVNVFLDGKFAFAIDLLTAAQLRKGQQLSEAEIETLQQNDEAKRTYDAALRSLASRPRSEKELRQILQRKGHDAELIDAAIERSKTFGYLDDTTFSHFWTENRQHFRPRSGRALRYELRQKGVESAVIDATLSGVDDDQAAWDAVQPKLARWQMLDVEEFEKKLKGFLARRGFGYETVERVWRRVQNPSE